MSAGNGPSVHRVLVAAGTARYRHNDHFSPLEKVPEAVATIVDLLTGWPREPYETLGQTQVTPSTESGRAEVTPGLLDPSLDELEAAIKAAVDRADVVIFYYTGHGEKPNHRPYYLILGDTDPADFRRSALRFSDLGEVLLRHDGAETATEQPHVLIIADCCYSGAGGEEALWTALEEVGNPNTWVLASAHRKEWAKQGVFPQALAKALAEPNVGTSTEYIGVDTVLELVKQHIPAGLEQQARCFPPQGQSSGLPPFFPNPGYEPYLDGLDGLSVAEQRHWRSRLRGGPEAMVEGFYLSGQGGRIDAAADLADWITQSGRQGLAVVTGSPGSGKSTVLALPIQLTQPEMRDRLLAAEDASRAHSDSGTPHLGMARAVAARVDPSTPLIAIHAQGLKSDQIAERVSKGLGLAAQSGEELIDDVAMSPADDAPVLIVDSVDEAEHPTGLLHSLLCPLADLGLKVVVGARRHVLRRVSRPDLLIDLDAPAYQDPGALVDYVAQLLRAANEPDVRTPYRDLPDQTVYRVAHAVAGIATSGPPGQERAESFLAAMVVANAVRGRPDPIDLRHSAWRRQLPATVGQAFSEDLARLDGLMPAGDDTGSP